jgi:2-methylisocitrate lyase-like PEP mutase family enzyme
VPNAFDAGSARVLEHRGFPTLATSSAAMAWTVGAEDGEALPFDEALTLHANVAAAVEVPVSVDFEGGYLDDNHSIADTVEAVIDAGIAGLNLEDTNFGPGSHPVYPAERHAEIIAEAREASVRAGVDLFIIGRTDVFMKRAGAAEERIEDAVRRLTMYAEAGADCVFAPGVVEEGDIAQLTRATLPPLNVMYMAGMPDLNRLAQLGVRRVTLGVALYFEALAAVEAAANALLDEDVSWLNRSALSPSAAAAVVNGGRS